MARRLHRNDMEQFFPYVQGPLVNSIAAEQELVATRGTDGDLVRGKPLVELFIFAVHLPDRLEHISPALLLG